MIARTFASVFPRQSPSSLIFASMYSEADSAGTGLFMLSSNSRAGAPSAGTSHAAPPGDIRQHEQVQTAEEEESERRHRQEAQAVGILPEHHGDCVDEDSHRKRHGQPAMRLPNPFVPVHWDLLMHDY